MKTNPGGRIDPKEAVGREEIVEQIWTILESQSIYMNAERRIGKTTILEILNSRPHGDWLPAKRDLEACHTAQEFSILIYEQIHKFFGKTQRAFRRTTEFLKQMGGMEIGGVLRFPEGKAVEWKTILEKAFQDLHEAQEGKGPRILFLWDEVPFMIDNIRKRENEKTAMEVLDTLRFIRQTYPSIRMVMTGSIGLHHVLAALKESGYANAPVNDMASIQVPSLTNENGGKLARLLMEGEKIQCDSIQATSLALSEAADHFPYYIHHLVRQLNFSGRKATPEVIGEILQQQITNPNDPWELKHYRNRVKTYYGKNENDVLAILDAVAAAGKISLKQIEKEISANAPGMNLEKLRELLTLLERDHYVRKTTEGYEFVFPLIRQWWRMDRSL